MGVNGPMGEVGGHMMGWGRKLAKKNGGFDGLSLKRFP